MTEPEFIVCDGKTAEIAQAALDRAGKKLKIYTDPLLEPGQILMGHKGKSILDTGYVYAPYVPLQVTTPLVEPVPKSPLEEFAEEVFKEEIEEGLLKPMRPTDTQIDLSDFRARHANWKTKLIKPEFFGTVNDSNL